MFNLDNHIEGNGKVTHVDVSDKQSVLKVILDPMSLMRRRVEWTLTEGCSLEQRLEKLCRIPGTEIVHRPQNWRDAVVKEGNDCVRHVFWEHKGEQWNLVRGKPDAERLCTETRQFLQEHGYIFVDDKPRNGDVVAYGRNLLSTSTKRREIFEHFGIIEDDSVLSKMYFVFRHPLAMLPRAYGDEAVFLRKKDEM